MMSIQNDPQILIVSHGEKVAQVERLCGRGMLRLGRSRHVLIIRVVDADVAVVVVAGGGGWWWRL
jgi:hypothetical protein